MTVLNILDFDARAKEEGNNIFVRNRAFNLMKILYFIFYKMLKKKHLRMER